MWKFKVSVKIDKKKMFYKFYQAYVLVSCCVRLNVNIYSTYCIKFCNISENKQYQQLPEDILTV
jgi:hypothetical protein